MYQSTNSRLNYGHYNLPLAAVKGSGFQEFIIRSNYEWKRIYADVKFIYYNLQKNYSETTLLPVNKVIIPTDGGNIKHTQLELGYRFNRKMNLCVFGSFILRNSHTAPIPDQKATLIFFGLRTGINNHYSDF
jgi:hypothetical protein